MQNPYMFGLLLAMPIGSGGGQPLAWNQLLGLRNFRINPFAFAK